MESAIVTTKVYVGIVSLIIYPIEDHGEDGTTCKTCALGNHALSAILMTHPS